MRDVGAGEETVEDGEGDAAGVVVGGDPEGENPERGDEADDDEDVEEAKLVTEDTGKQATEETEELC